MNAFLHWWHRSGCVASYEGQDASNSSLIDVSYFYIKLARSVCASTSLLKPRSFVHTGSIQRMTQE